MIAGALCGGTVKTLLLCGKAHGQLGLWAVTVSSSIHKGLFSETITKYSYLEKGTSKYIELLIGKAKEDLHYDTL